VRILGVAVVVALGAVYSRAEAQPRGAMQAELRMGAGYDDNLFLDAHPTGTTPSQVYADAIFDFEPRLDLRLLQRGHSLALTCDFLERATPSTGDLRDLITRLEYASAPVGPVSFVLAGLYEYYGVSLPQFAEDTFHLAGGEAGVRVRVGERLKLSALYRADARLYPDRSLDPTTYVPQTDVEQRAIVLAQARPHRVVALDLGYTFLHLASNNDQAQLDRHAVNLTVAVRPTRWLLLAAGYGLAWQSLANAMLDPSLPPGQATGPRSEFIHSAELAVTARPLRWLELFARYSLLYSSSTAAAGDYQRNQALVGVSLILDGERVLARPPPARPEVAPGAVTFRFVGRAARVSVVGDWNGWDPAAQPLSVVGDGRFAARVTLPAGRHEYALSVDGVVTRPPDAPGYRPDGFGGENGVVEVPLQ
jgi:hypothetical protein